MIRPSFFYDVLKDSGIDFYAGVPDSLLKNLCAYITDHADERHNIITANEGGAIGLAAGHYLATGQIPIVYMQNSGLGNIINPLASLTDPDVYNIPVLLVIGWRGKPGVHDEPQHVKQGKVTTGLLNVMGIDYTVLSKEEEIAEIQIKKAIAHMQATKQCYALLIEKDSFETYTLHNIEQNDLVMSREESIEKVVDSLPTNAVVVSTTGMISRELFEIRARRGEGHERDFLTVGSMGHASQIALGIALAQPNRPVFCFDGDGAVIMHMGGMAIVGSKQPRNLVHVIFNNGAHDSVGGQPTVGLKINMPSLAEACGYFHVFSANSIPELEEILDEVRKEDYGPNFIEIKVRKGNRKDLGRPTTLPVQNKESMMDFLSRS